MGSLQNRVILVTGGARRIGRSIALRLAAEGVRVGVHYSSSEADARLTSEKCGGQLFQADLTRVDEIVRLFQHVAERFGRLDGLVNNAARFARLDPLQITEADWDSVNSVNLKAVFFCCQQAAKLMLSGDGGHIVNISSLGGIRPWPEHVHYCASKAGVIHMTRALAVALAPRISVNSVAPGVIPFEEVERPEIQRYIGKTPAKRAGTGEDIAEAVLYFLNASRFTTGQILAVDGGLSLR
jgi:NAD(P)-dependent dehydrogenase (short-subunit alcohol dehydrogenase family)